MRTEINIKKSIKNEECEENSYSQGFQHAILWVLGEDLMFLRQGIHNYDAVAEYENEQIELNKTVVEIQTCEKSISHSIKMNNLEAIKLVKDLLYDRMNLIDHFYSGDKDTYREAYDEVIKRKHCNGFYDATVEERNINSEKYKNEIQLEYERLISYRKELISFYMKVDELLNDFDEQETHNV